MPHSSSVLCWHCDEALQAEIRFWATSANYQFIPINDAQEFNNYPGARAIVLELSQQGGNDLDTIEQAARLNIAKVVAVTALDAKTVSSVRRLLEAKGLSATIFNRTEFNTKDLAALLDGKPARTEMDRDMLAAAIRDGHVVAHYQPKVPFKPGDENFGVEALCRIVHPALGTLYPDTFIPIAEAQDLILDLTDAVTVHAFQSLAEWDKAGLKLRLALNISPRLMSDTVWFERFQERCQQFHIDPSRITLEVTESSSQGGKVLALEILSRLRLKGFQLSIDDFGTGFSSLETLYKLPFGELKIDKGFVFDLQKSSEARALVESTILLARKLGLKICAEGVESQELFDELRDLQCDDAQGYHISKAIAADKIVEFFAGWIIKRREADAKAEAPQSKFAAIHALMADLLSGDDDGDDATIVLSSQPADGAAGPEMVREIAGKIPALLMAGDLVAALAQIHRAISASGETDREFCRKLQKIQTQLEWALAAPQAVELRGADRSVQLRAGLSFIIGRFSPTASADVAIACRWMSRGEKNLRLFVQGSGWYLEDLGSTNGHFIEGQRLTPFKSHRLMDGETVLEIGKTGNAPAPARLSFRIGADKAVHMRFASHDQGQWHEEGEWILFDAEFALGRAADIALVMPDCGVDVAADISWRNNGLWIAPRAGETIGLDGSEFSHALPLMLEGKLAIGNTSWEIHGVAASPPTSLAATA